MRKFYFFIFIISYVFLLQNCGYKTIYSSNNLNFKIDEIKYSDNNLNNQIVKIIKSFSNSDALNTYDVKLKARKEKRVVSKNTKGDPQTYEIKITVEINIYNETNNYTKKFYSLSKYNDDENKFKLRQYELEIEKQIVEKIVEKILLFFTEI
jgi:hypothetical protein